jgi:hypothetical protein
MKNISFVFALLLAGCSRSHWPATLEDGKQVFVIQQRSDAGTIGVAGTVIRKDGDWLILNSSSPTSGTVMIPREKILEIRAPQ